MESCVVFDATFLKSCFHENPVRIFRLKNSKGFFHHASLVTPSERLPSFPERTGLTDNNLKTEDKEKINGGLK
jgi:hypothetical protein